MILAQDAQVTDARPSGASSLPSEGWLPHKGQPLLDKGDRADQEGRLDEATANP